MKLASFVTLNGNQFEQSKDKLADAKEESVCLFYSSWFLNSVTRRTGKSGTDRVMAFHKSSGPAWKLMLYIYNQKDVLKLN